MSIVEEFSVRLREGLVALHPTDTIPGLTFDPGHPEGKAALYKVKVRDRGKPVLCLAHDLDCALKLFQPVDPGWVQALSTIWPGPFSVVGCASSFAPKSLVSEQGKIGVRVPNLPDPHAWFAEVLREFGGVLPTTSINQSGDPPLVTFEDIQSFARSQGIYNPWTSDPGFSDGEPSTIVEILADGYRLIRRGPGYEKLESELIRSGIRKG